MKTLGVGLLGLGTVGAGVAEVLTRHADRVAARAGARLEIVRAAVHDPALFRGRGVPDDRLTDDAASVVAHPEVDLVVEVMGGLDPAHGLVRAALDAGRPVVSANKALLAERGQDLFEAAEARGVELRFEASVAGGIPVLLSLRDGLAANRIESIYGILNGTCNYILTRMEQERRPFDAVLAEAQASGYAEANPSTDIDGIDTAHKAVVLAALAYGKLVPFAELPIEGIRRITLADLDFARELGYAAKLLAVVRESADGEIEIRVEPTFVHGDHMLASVSGVFNAVKIHGDVVGDTFYHGRGAGREPTASAVVSDLIRVARGRLHPEIRPEPLHVAPGVLMPRDEWVSRAYLRVALLDQPGSLSKAAGTLGAHGISIASFIQKESTGNGFASVVFLTHPATERALGQALASLEALPEVDGPPVRIRIEDEPETEE